MTLEICPKCEASSGLRKAGTSVRSGGKRVQKMRCIHCGYVFDTDQEIKKTIKYSQDDDE